VTESGLYGMALTYAGLNGICLGSFMNVCIARMPEDRSVVHPGSACPRCGTPIRWFDNVPVLAWFWLRGRCRACKGRISGLYPVMEALFGVLAVLLFRKLIPELGAMDLRHLVAYLWYLYLLFALVALSFIDLKHFIIPDWFSIYGVPIGLGGAFLLENLGYREAVSWQESSVGALCGGGFLLSVMWIYQKIRKQEGMGMGDAKLMALLGSYFGAYPALVFVLTVAGLVGSVVGIVGAVGTGRGLQTQAPFGPFLALGAILWMFWGEHVFISWLRI
jgi:leader peptidase (prepilin peptidase)/N-methyltransferase